MSETAPDRNPPSGSRQVSEAVSHTVVTGGFFASWMAGFLLGWGADSLFGTRPLFIVIGIIAGAVTGFWKMWVTYGKGG